MLYLVHAAAWTAFIGARIILCKSSPGRTTVPKSQTAHASPYSAVLIIFHGVGFGVMYLGMARAGHGVRAQYLIPPQDRKSTRLNSSHGTLSRMPSSA